MLLSLIFTSKGCINMNEYILYQAYGNNEIISECKFALLRLLNIYNTENTKKTIPTIIIYTDQPESFSDFMEAMPIKIELINQAQILAWRGEINFVHRVKIEIIKNCILKYKGKILYMDTDTYCTQNLEEVYNFITPNQVVFHTNEGVIGDNKNKHFKKWRIFLKSQPLPFLDGFLPQNVNMWNAGVIGIEASHYLLLQKVIDITDSLYPKFPRHTIEQFSFCYVMESNGMKINQTSDYVFHYWCIKEMRTLLQSFFAKYKNNNLETLLAKSLSIHPDKYLIEKMKYQKSNGIKKAFLKLAGKQWAIDNYAI